MFTELRGKGFAMIAVNDTDSAKVIKGYLKENKFTFPVGMGGHNGSASLHVPDDYGVRAYPTNYVLDAQGKVIWCGVGFDESALRAALAKLGVR